MSKNIDFEASGALEPNQHDSHPFEYQTNTFQTCAMGDLMPEGQIGDMMDHARTLDGEEMRIGWEREQAIAQGVMRRPNERVDPDNQSMPLEMIERINGEVDELERQYENAHRAEAAGHNREAACADDVTNRERAYESRGEGWFNIHAVPRSLEDVGQGRVTKHTPVEEFEGDHGDMGPRDDPRAEMDSETLGKIYEMSDELHEHFKGEVAIGRGRIGYLLAIKVANGASVHSAFFGVKQMIERRSGVAQPIKTIDPFEQDETDVVVTVTNVSVPKSNSQAQWMQVVDESTDMPTSMTVWKKAGRKTRLRKGDKARISNVKVNAYKSHGEWQTSLAVVADSEIQRLECGDGDLIYRARSNSLCNQTDRMAPWEAGSKANNWHNGMAEEGTTTNDYAAAAANRFVLDPEFGDDEYSAYLNRRDE